MVCVCVCGAIARQQAKKHPKGVGNTYKAGGVEELENERPKPRDPTVYMVVGVGANGRHDKPDQNNAVTYDTERYRVSSHPFA